MSKDMEIEILMWDGCTKVDAIRHLENGSIVFEDPDEWIDTLKGCGNYDGETIEDVRAGKIGDVSIVKYNDHEYLIMYVL